MKEIKETHQKGTISIENIPTALESFNQGEITAPSYAEVDLSLQVAKDGRIWICINEIAFLRFKPEGMGSGPKE